MSEITNLQSTAGFVAGDRIRLGGEYYKVLAVPNSTTLTVKHLRTWRGWLADQWAKVDYWLTRTRWAVEDWRAGEWRFE